MDPYGDFFLFYLRCQESRHVTKAKEEGQGGDSRSTGFQVFYTPPFSNSRVEQSENLTHWEHIQE
jgi:hypothetical protein